MSRRKRRRKPINGAAVLAPAPHHHDRAVEPAPKPEPAPELTVRPAISDEDVVAIHAFLIMVSRESDALQAPINPEDSISEVWRVVHNECALMAIIGDQLVGTIGLVQVPWWYNNASHFLTDRWFFVLPEHRNGLVAKVLLAEAAAVAEAAELPPPIINLKQRRRDSVTYMRPVRPHGLPPESEPNVLRPDKHRHH
jgi:GNAT superfamily N-acetyltransferase